MEIENELEWGYLCRQTNSYLSGASKKPTIKLHIGQRVSVVVVGKTNQDALFFELKDDMGNA